MSVLNLKKEAGNRYGMLTVLEYAGPDKNGQATWLCQCDCGETRVRTGAVLRRGDVRSCGCLRGMPGGRQQTTAVGLSSHYMNRAWRSMISRCEDPNSDNYAIYGGRGIRVCERWHDMNNFLEDMGERPDGMTLDRVDVEGNYEPGNCRWATTKEQNSNRVYGRQAIMAARAERDAWAKLALQLISRQISTGS